MSLNAYIKQKGIQINNLIFHFKKLEKIQKQIKPKVVRRKEIIVLSGN